MKTLGLVGAIDTTVGKHYVRDDLAGKVRLFAPCEACTAPPPQTIYSVTVFGGSWPCDALWANDGSYYFVWGGFTGPIYVVDPSALEKCGAEIAAALSGALALAGNVIKQAQALGLPSSVVFAARAYLGGAATLVEAVGFVGEVLAAVSIANWLILAAGIIGLAAAVYLAAKCLSG